MSDSEITKDNLPKLDLKLLNRFRKIYLYKQKFYQLRQAGEVTDDVINEFLELLPNVQRDSDFHLKISDIDDYDRIEWFDATDSQSFKAEASQIVKKLPIGKARDFQNGLAKFELKFCSFDDSDHVNLYYGKLTKGILYERRKLSKCDKYASLDNFIQRNYPAAGATNSATALENLRRFIKKDLNNLCSLEEGKSNESVTDADSRFPKYAAFVFENSDEFKRRILNVFFSAMANVDSSDEVPFVRKNGQPIDYTIFRILVWLRNPNFKFDSFSHFLSSIDAKDLPNRMTIDYGITGVIKLFIKYVSDPEWIDNLIKTHRIVKGLWQNGSKFLNSYTLHNEDHAVKLINLSVDIQKRIDYIQLKRVDFYILFLSCYLHDLSMVIHPDLQEFSHVDYTNLDCMASLIDDLRELINRYNKTKMIPIIEDGNQGIEHLWKQFGVYMITVFQNVYSFFENKVRDNHSADSAKFIIEKGDTLFSYIDPSTLSEVAQTGRNHAMSSADIFDIVSNAGEDSISRKYISMVLRLADLLDVSNDRINYYLLNENVKHLPEVSRFHWISHLITDEIRLIPKYRTEYDVYEVNGHKYKDFYIAETLRFYLILNVKSINPIEVKACNRCSQWFQEKYLAINEQPDSDKEEDNIYEAYKDYDGIKIKFGKGKCQYENCPMICRWITHKHNWLFEELRTLENYLLKVNHPPFRTKIEVNVLFKDLFKIEPHLYDSVVDYLKKNN